MVSMDGYLTLATKPSQCDEKRERGGDDGWMEQPFNKEEKQQHHHQSKQESTEAP